MLGDAFGAGIVAHLCREQLLVPAKRLNSISFAASRTKRNEDEMVSGDEVEEEDNNTPRQDIALELVEERA